jgi:putative DNA primase/helicase
MLEAVEAYERAGDWAPRHIAADEDSVALAFADRYKKVLRFDHTRGSWLIWADSHWEVDRHRTAFNWCRDMARAASATAERPAAARRANFARGVEDLARADPRLSVAGDEWDRDPWLLGTPDGTVDMRTGILRPACPTDMITRSTGATPAERADCPRWRAFLAEATGGDEALMAFLQRWGGYCLTGMTTEHALVFLHGMGGTGKSLFISTLGGILGGYAATAPMEIFMASRGDRHPTELAMLAGARLVTASETEDGRAWAEARVKQLTGGDAVTARFMRQDFFTFVPSFKIMVVGNHRPVLASPDDAVRRRFNMVPFDRRPVAPDPNLAKALRGEWPGILRWLIEGCIEWQAKRLAPPAIVAAATDDYLDAEDVPAGWLEECAAVEPGNPQILESAAALFASWRSYAEARGEPPGTAKRLGESLRRCGLERRPSV